MSGEVTELDTGTGSVVVTVAGKNAWGNHVTGSVTLALPTEA
jgi:hypothetical protein